MPSPQQHIVARYALELDFMDRHAAHRGSEAMMEASRRHIAALIEECCSELVGPDEYITIPRLEIDLGTLDPLHFVDGYLDRFKQLLRQQMKAAIAAQSQPAPLERALQVVADYGATGQYPWWAGSPDPAILHRAIATLLREGGSQALPQMRALLSQGKVLQRLVLALPPAQLAEIWEQLVSPAQNLRQPQAIMTLSRAIIHHPNAIDRGRWQGFVYKSIALALPTNGAAAAAPGDILLWLQMETTVALPAAWASRLAASAEFALLLTWLQSCLEAPGALVVAWLLAKSNPLDDPRELEAATGEFKAWLHTRWNLGSSTAQALLTALQTGLGDHQQAAQESEAAIEVRISAWLRGHFKMPEGKPSELLAQLAAQYVAQASDARHDAEAIAAWLHAQPAMPPEAPALLAQVLLPLVIAQVRSQQAAHHPPDDAWQAHLPLLRDLLKAPRASATELIQRLASEASRQLAENEPTAEAVAAWLRSRYSLTADLRMQVAVAVSGLLLPQWRPQVAGPGDPLQRYLPLLRDALHAPHASAPELIQRLASEASRQLADAEPAVEAIADSLRSNYSLTSELRMLVAEAVSALLLPQWRPRAAQPARPFQHYLPSLRALLELPNGQEADLIASLKAHFTEAHPTATQDETQLMAWLKSLELPAGGDLQALATAMLELDVPTRRPAAVPVKYIALQPMLPWLRRKLDLAAADAETILEALLEQYYAAHPGAAASQVLMEQWLDRHLQMPKSKRATTAQAMAQFAQQPKPASSAIPQDQKQQPRPPSSPAPSELPYFVENAGLVILWPMLQRYFQFAGLVEDKAFVSVFAQEQAVRLLQMLVMGDGEWNEAALALPKVLCGLSPDALVDPFVEVDAAQIEGIDTLVGAVLAHWTLAGELTVEGFRQAWLQRSGTLRLRDDHWLLRIEARGHDMILEGLPWDIAYIQLPWMRNVLYVDWGDKAKFNA